MAKLEVNGSTIYYERSGTGPAVLFVHGTAGYADVWTDQAERLSGHYTCVRFDRRGHSRSTRGDLPVSYETYAADNAAIIEALGLAPCLLVGSSSGGAITVATALRYGHLLRGIAVSEPPLFSLDRTGSDALLGELVDRVERARANEGPEAGIDAFFEVACPHFWPTIDEERKRRYRANADIAFTDLHSLSIDLKPADLAELTIPALVIGGTESHPSMRSVARRLASALPDARFVELQGSGHVTYAERPDDFADALAVFASEVGRRSRSIP